MTKLNDLLAKPLIKGPVVGIEIEAEGEGMKIINTELWNSCDDGSLRGEYPSQRHEFVSTPLAADVVEKALDLLIESQKGAVFDFSFRTSAHVHVNCLDMEVNAVGAFAYTYFLLERDLMAYCGEHRNNNRFCLRMVDSDELAEVLRTLIEVKFREMRIFINDDMRYGACNMASLSKYGTLEFRGMRGTLDKEVLLNWIGALLKIRAYAIEKGNAWEVYNEAVKDSEHFHNSVLGNLTDVFIHPNSRHNLAEALSLCVEIPFTARQVLEEKKVKQANPKNAAANPFKEWHQVMQANVRANQAHAARMVFNGNDFVMQAPQLDPAPINQIRPEDF